MSMTDDIAPIGATSATSAVARRAMIDSQLRPSGVNEPWLLAAMGGLPREDFVPEAMRAAAYIDRAIPLGGGRFLAAPLVHGRMLSEAAPRPGDIALLVGDGAGYLAALLRSLVGRLDTVPPAELDQATLAGDHTLVVIDGAIEAAPAAIRDALVEGGRIVTGLVERGVARLATGRKTAGEIALLPLAEMGIPIIAELAAPRRWSF